MADASIPLTADRRVPFTDEYAFLDADYTGSTWVMQLRSIKDTTGSPLVDCSSGVSLVYAGTDTVANHVTAGRLAGSGDDNIYDLINPATGVNYAATDSVLLSWVRISLGVSTLADVPIPNPPGADVSVWYDIIREPTSGNNEILMKGPFTVLAGVSVP